MGIDEIADVVGYTLMYAGLGLFALGVVTTKAFGPDDVDFEAGIGCSGILLTFVGIGTVLVLHLRWVS